MVLRELDRLRQQKKRPVYGWEVIKGTGLKSGAVYPILERLWRNKHVKKKVEPAVQAHKQGRPRRVYYEFTPEGELLLQQALDRLKERGLN